MCTHTHTTTVSISPWSSVPNEQSSAWAIPSARMVQPDRRLFQRFARIRSAGVTCTSGPPYCPASGRLWFGGTAQRKNTRASLGNLTFVQLSVGTQACLLLSANIFSDEGTESRSITAPIQHSVRGAGGREAGSVVSDGEITNFGDRKPGLVFFVLFICWVTLGVGSRAAWVSNPQIFSFLKNKEH